MSRRQPPSRQRSPPHQLRHRNTCRSQVAWYRRRCAFASRNSGRRRQRLRCQRRLRRESYLGRRQRPPHPRHGPRQPRLQRCDRERPPRREQALQLVKFDRRTHPVPRDQSGDHDRCRRNQCGPSSLVPRRAPVSHTRRDRGCRHRDPRTEASALADTRVRVRPRAHDANKHHGLSRHRYRPRRRRSAGPSRWPKA